MNLKDARVQKTRNNIDQVFFKLLKRKTDFKNHGKRNLQAMLQSIALPFINIMQILMICWKKQKNPFSHIWKKNSKTDGAMTLTSG